MLDRPIDGQHRRAHGEPGVQVPVGENRGVMLASLLMFIVGWGGLAQLVLWTRPRIGGEIWLFFILLQIAVTGTAIPLVTICHKASGTDSRKCSSDGIGRPPQRLGRHHCSDLCMADDSTLSVAADCSNNDSAFRRC